MNAFAYALKSLTLRSGRVIHYYSLPAESLVRLPLPS
jgi:hypothetical protein